MLIAVSLLLVVFAACGPEESTSDQEALTAQTQQIAQQFAADGDITRARAQLETLEVANASQWLLFLTEQYITEEANPATTQALARLVGGLGLQSSVVSSYAAANNLSPAGEAVAEAASTAQPAATPTTVVVAPTAQAAQVAEPTAQAAVALPAATHTPTPAPGAATPEPLPTPTQDLGPMVAADTVINVRGGPGTAYEIVGALQPSEDAAIVAKSPASDWWQVELPDGLQGWVFAELVTESGDLGQVAVAADIPEPPPTATPAPVVAEAPAAEPTAAPAAAPAAEATAAPEPAPPPSDQPHFTLVQKRLWSMAENGGCRGQHLLRIHVLDANGNRLNNVRLKGIYIGEIMVTGAQGKGDGIIEYDLHGSGEGFYVLQDQDGREVTSDRAEGFSTKSYEIDQQLLMDAGYCRDKADCDAFLYPGGCFGHHSWEATFQRSY